jgi:ankyrin repeat protein
LIVLLHILMTLFGVQEISEALSNDAWRVLTDAIRQQQQLQVRQYQQHQLAQLPDSPPATPYTHIDHFVNREGATFVHSAIARSDVRSLRTCLELGADVNRPTRTTKRSPLHLAVERVCQLQFEAHADPSDPAGVVGGIGSKVVDMGSSVVSSVTNLISAKRVPAHDELIGLAIMCVSVLIDAGADVNLQDRDANTVLHTAVKASHTLLVKCLLAAGADASIRNKGGHTPVSFARSLDTLEALLNNQNQRESRAPRTLVAESRSSASLAVHPVDDATVDPPLTRTSLRNSTANVKPTE